MIASSFQAPSSSKAVSSSTMSDGMMSITLAHPKIYQIVEPFLLDQDAESDCINHDANTLLKDEILVDFGCKYRIVVRKCADDENKGNAIAMHVSMLGWGDNYNGGDDRGGDNTMLALKSLRAIFGESNIIQAASRKEMDSGEFGEGKDNIDPHPVNAVAEGYNLCIRMYSRVLPEHHDAGSIATLLSKIRAILLGSRLQDALGRLMKGERSSSKDDNCTFAIPSQRTNSTGKSSSIATSNMIVSCQLDRVTVVVPAVFHDETDRALARLFLQQFEQAQRRMMGSKNVPLCDYRRANNPPRELSDFIDNDCIDGINNGNSGVDELAGFLSLTFLQSHVDSNEKVEKAVENILMLFDFIDYHVKCSKSNIHSRMRQKKNALLDKLVN